MTADIQKELIHLLRQLIERYVEDMKVSSIFTLSGKPYDFTKLRTPKKNSARRIRASWSNDFILITV